MSGGGLRCFIDYTLPSSPPFPLLLRQVLAEKRSPWRLAAWRLWLFFSGGI